MAKLTIGDVAEIRALARQIKLSKYDSVQDTRDSLHDELSNDVSKPMLEMLQKLCDPDVIEDICTRAIADFHANGEI